MTQSATGPADFWSRRRARVAAEEAAEARAAEALAGAAQEAALAEKSDAQICEEMGLPDPDTLGPGDDFRAFMERAVPERLRRRALRKLWLSNPALANLDGMVDYGEDFTDSACVIEGMQTAYQVGKGMLKHVQELARQEAAAEAEAAKEAGGEPPEAMALAGADATPGVDEAPEEPPAPEIAAEAQEVPQAMPPAEAADDAPLPPRRRMRFAFAGADGDPA